MAVPADSSSTTAATTAGQDEAVVKTTMPVPLPRAIQLVMTISPRWKSSTTTTASTKTIGELGEHGADRVRVFLWIKLVFLPSMYIAAAAGMTYCILRDGGELISGAGGFGFRAVPVLLCVYMAVLEAAGGHLGLFAPRTPYAAWEAFHKGTFHEGMGFLVVSTSFGVWVLRLIDQAWPLLVAWTYLLGLLVASIVALWLCLLRTYGDGGGERRGNSSCEAVIDGLAYLYSRLLYEYAVRFLAVADADADAGMQQLLDADVAVV
jgi:hypothetical protein